MNNGNKVKNFITIDNITLYYLQLTYFYSAYSKRSDEDG